MQHGKQKRLCWAQTSVSKRIGVLYVVTGELICWHLERDAAKADRLAKHVAGITILKGQEK